MLISGKEERCLRSIARTVTALTIGMFALAVFVTAQSKDPFVGSWSLNVAKSKYTPGPAPKSVTSTYEAAGKGYKFPGEERTSLGARCSRNPAHFQPDGTDSPVTGNNANADTIAVKRIDANTSELVSKKGGKVTTTQRNVASADGKTRTVTTTGTDAQGQKVNNVAVFEKS